MSFGSETADREEGGRGEPASFSGTLVYQSPEEGGKREEMTMATVLLGRTGIEVEKNGFGALPIQRIALDAAASLLQKAYEGGIRYFDTARSYTDSEEKIGAAFGNGLRQKLYIATKTPSQTAEGFWKDLETSLRLMRTDYIDVYQFHNPSFCPKPGDGTGLYEAMLEAKRQGKIRFIGLTNHRLPVAREAVESGLYDVLQFPFSYLADAKDVELVHLCAEKNVGFVAMKALSGGLITNSAAAYAALAQYENVLPIWGVQRESELSEFLSYIENPPVLTPELAAVIERDRKELAGDFCRGHSILPDEGKRFMLCTCLQPPSYRPTAAPCQRRASTGYGSGRDSGPRGACGSSDRPQDSRSGSGCRTQAS